MKIHDKKQMVTITFSALDLIIKDGQFVVADWEQRFSKEHEIKRYTLPRDLYDKRRRFFDLKFCQLQNQHRDKEIHKSFYHFIEVKGRTQSTNRNRSIAATKGQISRLENEMANYLQAQAQKLFFDKDTDPIYQKAISKLNRQRNKLKQLIHINN